MARADIAAGFEVAIVDVLVKKALLAVKQTDIRRLVVAGGVGANRRLRLELNQACARRRMDVYYPPLALCTDNGAMIALAGALRLKAGHAAGAFGIKPRWPLSELAPV